MAMLDEELQTWKKKKPELLKQHRGEFVVIKGKEVIGTFESQKDAIGIGIDRFGNEPYLVKRIQDVDEIQNFTSNLIRCT